MPHALDLTLLALITVVATLFETFVFLPRFKTEVAAGVPNAKRNGYRRAVIGQWVLTFIAVVIWIRAGRSWTALGVAPHSRVRLLIGLALVVAVAALAAQQARAVYRLGAERLAALKP